MASINNTPIDRLLELMDSREALLSLSELMPIGEPIRELLQMVSMRVDSAVSECGQDYEKLRD